MQLIRRAAVRAAASAPSTSFIAKSRSINTSSPFALRIQAKSPISSAVFRRFNSDDAENRGEQDAAHEQPSITREMSAERQQNRGGFRDRGQQAGSGRGDRDAPPPMNRPFEQRVMTPSPKIYVGNLLFEVTAADLEREFEQFGPIKSAILATDNRGLSKGFGYVEFGTVEEATAAIEAKNLSVLEGRRLVVNYMNQSQRNVGESAPSKTLFIGNLAFEMSDADLNKLFREIKNVVDVRVAIDRRTGQPRGFAHADFTDVESAVKGKEMLVGKEVYGRTLRIDFSSSGNKARGSSYEGGGDKSAY